MHAACMRSLEGTIYNKRGCGGGFPVQICTMKIYPEGRKEDNYTTNEELNCKIYIKEGHLSELCAFQICVNL